MKPLLAAAFALGLPALIGSEVRTVDPKTLSFSLATINDALPACDAKAAPGAKDFVIHEDDWRQFEAVARSLDAEMQEELAEVRRMYQEKSKVSGGYRIFSELHVRKKISRPLPAPLAWAELLATTGTPAAAVAGVAVRGQGVVKDGFSFRVGEFTIYGIRHGERVEVLCFGFTKAPGLGEEEAQRFAAFVEKSEVVVVHWPSASVLKDQRALTNYLKQKR